MQNRAKLLPGSTDGQPIIMWDGERVHFPVRDELVLHASEGGTPPPPQAKVIDGSGRVLCTHEASLEEVIGETAEAEVRARARATVERLQALLEAGRAALAARPGGPAGSDLGDGDEYDDEHDDEYEEEDDASISFSVEFGGESAGSPVRAFFRHASRGAASYLIWAFLLPLAESAAAGMPGESGILLITSIAGLFLPVFALLNGFSALFDLLDML